MYQVTQAVSLLPVYLPTTLSLSQLSHVFWKRHEQSPSPFPDFSFALHSYRDKVFPPTYILKLLWQELPLTSVWPNPKEIFNLWNYLLIFPLHLILLDIPFVSLYYLGFLFSYFFTIISKLIWGILFLYLYFLWYILPNYIPFGDIIYFPS